jgi:hypothetical protein
VENFRKFYSGNDYVTQMDALVKYMTENPDAAYGWFLRGYHYKYLGYDAAARKQLAQAMKLESRDQLAVKLFVMAGGQLPDQSTPKSSDTPAKPADSESPGEGEPSPKLESSPKLEPSPNREPSAKLQQRSILEPSDKLDTANKLEAIDTPELAEKLETTDEPDSLEPSGN